MIKRLLSFGAAALATLVGGCGDGPSTVAGGYRSPATWSSFVYATSPGPLLLEVVGDPFGAGSGTLGRTIAATMAAAIPARPFTLTTETAAAPRSNFRVVLVLGGDPSLDERAICAGRGKAEAAKIEAGGRVDLIATFCDGEALLSSVRGWVAKIDGADDRRFHRLLGQVARELMGESIP
ncbi:MAG: hypothetical protein EPN20_17740 [Magnetospirillum sp.]|nr:MAG: hypothetical protein EPN20_17740 [Magnetospirillum sp.]